MSRLEEYRLVASSLGLRLPAWHLLKKMCSVEHVYYLTAPIDRLRFPRLRSDIEFALATESDLVESLQGLSTLDDLSRKELGARVLLFRHGFTSCRVGRTRAGQIVSVQWLIRPADNPLLEKYLRGRRYLLSDHQVMMENVFVFPPFRGVGLFPTVNHDTISIARQEGFRICKAYVAKDNIASLNSYFSLGFRIEKLLTSYQIAGRTWGTIGRQGTAATRAS
jgi:ribosomal protein S18 acetylase RimI-like enzyme